MSEKIIHSEIKTTSSHISVLEAELLLIKNKVNFLHIVDDSIYLGSIHSDDLLNEKKSTKISDINHLWRSIAVEESFTWLELFECFARNETVELPLVDDLNVFLDIYRFERLFEKAKKLPLIEEYGHVVVVSKNINSYSISEITQIIEQQNNRLLGVFISDTNTQQVEITIKFIARKFNETLQVLRRFGYNIVSEHIEDELMEELKEHADYFNKYLTF